jgi:osmoprotectant transport system permease protein
VLLYREELDTLQPHLVRTWRALEGRISTEQMIELNARVKLDRQPESRVAADFLRSTLGLDVAAEPPPRPAWLTVAERIATSSVEHLFLVGVSLAAAVAAGVPLGVVAHRRPRLGAGILALVGMIQTIPSLAVLVFMIPLLGLGAAPAIAALFLYTLLPIVRGTVSGLAQIPGPLIESAQVLGLAGWSRLRLIELPLASPSILSGIKTAAVINVGTATIGALIGAGGYGQVILTGIRLADHDLLLQGAVPAAVLALAVQSAFNAAERFVIPAGLRAARPRA